MTAYPLKDLVRVRRHREEQASQEVSRAQRKKQEAEEAVKAAEQALREYTTWRVAEEKRKLDGLMRRALRLGELSDVRMEISLLREKEFTFIDHLKKAQAEAEKAKLQLEEARQKHAKSVRALEKLLEHERWWVAEAKQVQEQQEDLELEEFSPKRPHLNTYTLSYESH